MMELMTVQGCDFVATYSSSDCAPNLAHLSLRAFRMCPVRGSVTWSMTDRTTHHVFLRPPHADIRPGFIATQMSAFVRREQVRP